MSRSTDSRTFDDFVAALRESIARRRLVRLTLAKPRQKNGPKRAALTPTIVRGTTQYKFVESTDRQDRTTICDVESLNEIEGRLGESFLEAYLLTLDGDWTLRFNRRGEPHVQRTQPTNQELPRLDHNRQKSYLVPPDAEFLKRLGICDRHGKVHGTMSAKYKQMQRFVEIIDELIEECKLQSKMYSASEDALRSSATGIRRESRPLHDRRRVVDIGSGKGYLTFALAYRLMQTANESYEVIGIERRPDLVDFCNLQAREVGFEQLKFVSAEANQAPMDCVDILIALHACDTATDDAIAMGIAAEASLIVCAPCCQHELAKQLVSREDWQAGLLEHGLIRHRQADLVTDTARSLLLGAAGYRVKIIEFVSSEHTAKNLMIAAVRDQAVDRTKQLNRYDAIKASFGFFDFALEKHLIKSGLIELLREFPESKLKR